MSGKPSKGNDPKHAKLKFRKQQKRDASKAVKSTGKAKPENSILKASAKIPPKTGRARPPAPGEIAAARIPPEVAKLAKGKMPAPVMAPSIAELKEKMQALREQTAKNLEKSKSRVVTSRPLPKAAPAKLAKVQSKKELADEIRRKARKRVDAPHVPAESGNEAVATSDKKTVAKKSPAKIRESFHQRLGVVKKKLSAAKRRYPGRGKPAQKQDANE
ncbi:MAG: hypothetical protein NUW37_00880 [Planctomycetes bacterium]|nr:hypothetical protein [Planctomycetota bacterium]